MVPESSGAQLILQRLILCLIPLRNRDQGPPPLFLLRSESRDSRAQA